MILILHKTNDIYYSHFCFISHSFVFAEQMNKFLFVLLFCSLIAASASGPLSYQSFCQACTYSQSCSQNVASQCWRNEETSNRCFCGQRLGTQPNHPICVKYHPSVMHECTSDLQCKTGEICITDTWLPDGDCLPLNIGLCHKVCECV